MEKAKIWKSATMVQKIRMAQSASDYYPGFFNLSGADDGALQTLVTEYLTVDQMNAICA